MSPSTCAICMNPIIKPQKILITGTEAVHRTCAATGHQTIGQRQNAIAARAAAMCERLQRELDELQRINRDDAKQFLETISAVNQRQVVEGTTARELRQVLEQQLQDADNERRRLAVELDAARAELAQRNAPAKQQDLVGDDAEQRFSLLELDPL